LEASGHKHISNVVVGDACDLQSSGIRAPSDGETTFVVALEVLDNLPHDKAVWVPNTGDSHEHGSWHETYVQAEAPTPSARTSDDTGPVVATAATV